MILSCVTGGESELFCVNCVVDVGGTAACELGNGIDSEDVGVDGRDEELIAVDELHKVEGLPGGEGMGDKRKLRMGRDPTGLEWRGSS